MHNDTRQLDDSTSLPIGESIACSIASKVLDCWSESILVTDLDGTIVAVNPAFTLHTGYSASEVIGQTPRILKSGRHQDGFYADLWQALLNTGKWVGEIWDRRKDGSLYLKSVTINALRDHEGRMTHFVAISHEITQSKEHENLIRYLAEHDILTGLPNRRVLHQTGQQLISSVRQGDREFALLVIDLDRFKNINDALGHRAGDEVLIQTSKRLNKAVRSTDTVVRLGGDEFVVLLSGVSNPIALSEIVSNLHKRLNEPMVIQGRTVLAPPSIGIACYPSDGEDMDTLLYHADAAMYRSKARGGNDWTFYTTEINAVVTERLALEEALRNALEEGSLALHYQPLIHAETGCVLSWEALLRWNHPKLGNISPERIIPVAEETGLIHKLGNWVIQTACAQVKQWEESGYGQFRVSVNVSPSQLDHPSLESFILKAIKDANIQPSQLEIEITESVLISHSPVAMQTLQNLRLAGLLVALDDFGTGYSSLNYLRTLSVDRVKIDRSFVTHMVQREQDAAIVQAVVSLANSLSLGVVAEGVENAEQQDLLARSGCTEMQGFLLGRPMPIDAIEEYLDHLPSRN